MSDVADVLNGLIETCKDGEQGFQQVAEKAKEGSLKAMFSKYSSQRATYAQELQAAVSALGEKPSESGHVAAGLHRGWISVKEALSKDEDKSLINEAESGERCRQESLYGRYRKDSAHRCGWPRAKAVRRSFWRRIM